MTKRLLIDARQTEETRVITAQMIKLKILNMKFIIEDN